MLAETPYCAWESTLSRHEAHVTLRTKAFLVAGLGTLVLALVLALISRTVIRHSFERVGQQSLAGFAQVEEEQMQQHTARVLDALAGRLDGLAVKGADWAEWDDTYGFMADGNEAYRRSNLTPDSLKNLRLNGMLFVRTSGQVVATVSYDLAQKREAPVLASLLPHVKPGAPLVCLPETNSVVTGLVLLPETPVLLAARAVVTSSGTGPVRGAVVLARYLDATEVQDLAALTHLNIQLWRVDAADLPADLGDLRGALTAPRQVITRALDDETLAGYAALFDLYGKRCAYLRVTTPRPVHARGQQTLAAIQTHGRETVWFLVGIFALAGLVAALVLVGLLEVSVLARLKDVSRQVTRIGAAGDFAARLEPRGNDELTRTVGSINDMLAALATSHRVIAQRKVENDLLMATVPIGLLSLDETFRINPEYSRAAARMLGYTSLAGRRFVDILQPLTAPEALGAQVTEFLEQLQREALPEKEMAALSPLTELTFATGGETRCLTFTFHLMRRGAGNPSHLLVVVEDITASRRLAAEVEQSRQENLQLKEIARAPDVYREFLSESLQALTHVETEVVHLRDPLAAIAALHLIFRGVHTVKGMAGGFGLALLAEACSRLEDRLARLAGGAVIPEVEVAGLAAELRVLVLEVEANLAQLKALVGDTQAVESGALLPIPLPELARRILAVQQLLTDVGSAVDIPALARGIRRELHALREVPASRGLARAARLMASLMTRSGKDIHFRFEGQELRLDCELARQLNVPLMHLLRNAVVHGVEDSDVRLAHGKSSAGQVILTVGRDTNGLYISVADDGNGINPQRLRQVAVDRGLVSAAEAASLSENACRELIFAPGFSTATDVDMYAGRGIGLVEVRGLVRDALGGELKVDSEPGQGACFTIRVPSPQL